MSGIYIHIPLCKSRCWYCSFYSTTSVQGATTLVKSLATELKLRKNFLPTNQISTIYFGGGTPSQLSTKHIATLLETIGTLYEVGGQAEITFEANPCDLTPIYMAELRALGINRLSIGVQSFQNEQLTTIGRRHTASQAIEAVQRAKAVGFDNISIDLIYGLPNQTMQLWQHDLRQAVELKVQHISAYGLTYEEGTKLYRQWQQGRLAPLTDDEMNTMYDYMVDYFKENGIEQYEVSNFCVKGKCSQHNSSYWNMTPYLGIGPSAHSFDGVHRYWNLSALATYIESMESEQLCLEGEELSSENRYNEFVMVGLRTTKGIDLTLLEEKFGWRLQQYCLKQANPYLHNGALMERDKHLMATSKGFKILNMIITSLMLG